MKYRTAQLNAISRSYTEKARKEALKYLSENGIDFEKYCKETGWKASPVRLVTKLKEQAKKL